MHDSLAVRSRLLIVVGLTLALFGCSDAAQGEATGQNGSAMSQGPQVAPTAWRPELFANDHAAFNYFVGKGLTNFQAAGIVGNLDQESGVDPNAVQSGGPGRGIAQWSVGGRWDTDSGDNATAYASQHGQSVWSLQLQLDFIWYELTTFSGYGLSRLRGTTNVTDATVVFQTDFEGCGTCLQSQRVAYAQQVLAAYGSVEYGAAYVGQSFPLASTTMTMTEGQVVQGYIELRNTGTKTWDSNTMLGTTQPRDRTSAFADSSWVAPNRPARVSGTVAPGASYKFTFNLHAPNATGSHDEFFGVVQEGVAWFSDSGQGGPPDNQLEVKIDVVAGPAPDAGTTPHDAGSAHDAGTAHDGAAPNADGGGIVLGDSGALGDDGGGGVAASWSSDSSGGCSVGSSRGGANASALALLAAFAIITRRAAARRRSSSRDA